MGVRLRARTTGPFDRGGQIRLARHALDGRTRPVDVALRLAARGAGT